MLFIESSRLKLIPLNHQQLLQCHHNRSAFEKSLGLQVSDMIIHPDFRQEMSEAMQNCWLPNTLAYPELYQWYTNWEIVLKDNYTAIGGIAFGGYPDDYGETSIGYVVDQQHWGKSYATEAVLTLCTWGFSFSTLKAIGADTAVGNYASQKVLLKAGFRKMQTVNSRTYFKLSKRQHTTTKKALFE
ncbi:GNAT family N-acetyltransferase [Mucilaginibacter robiniae]|uniref:GNAT family N-acetyltransferase n=1 Tax=Mucilaginibacter robiniae TaxID=2728022 RepID=A0A7L5E7Q4_9SPHI|nr:GNAT family N-acetyltransferase [Mucilaginibacter robiniae]QJD96883.1 GNAT family N-acetyltransferase [Mucilaginibacter robiniae]